MADAVVGGQGDAPALHLRQAARGIQRLPRLHLQTRRASTTVELRDGESFAIAGLLRADKQGKEVFYLPTEAGEAAVQRYRAVREACLVDGLDAQLNPALGDQARLLRTMSGHYDQAARAASSL